MLFLAMIPSVITRGSRGFSDVIWTVEDHQEDSHLTLTYNSFDGEQDFRSKITPVNDVSPSPTGKSLRLKEQPNAFPPAPTIGASSVKSRVDMISTMCWIIPREHIFRGWLLLKKANQGKGGSVYSKYAALCRRHKAS
ncbi:hypothetical protein HAX54_028129 [Datura stramonium]|uniref:Uncharacterized protein n=1 Tax=Datura stramonium TaxID=4076 RepID=A0ABS8S9C6_DATST|nr:hypothetical protein [Datura stramonium]